MLLSLISTAQKVALVMALQYHVDFFDCCVQNSSVYGFSTKCFATPDAVRSIKTCCYCVYRHSGKITAGFFVLKREFA